MRKFIAPIFAAVSALAVSLPANAQDRKLEDIIVYLECTANGKTSRGTGVVVSEQGHVLTAKHVIPDGADCRGSLGVADSNNAARMIVQPTNQPVDVALLRFSRQDSYDFTPVCTLQDWMVRKKIFVAGYPGGTQTGAPSYREGILSTVVPNSAGILETDGQTVAGMSGGPVFSKNLAGLVGIVIGADFAADGTVSYYGILPVSLYRDAFQLTESKAPCYRESRFADLSDPTSGDWKGRWTAGDAEVKLGVMEDEGFCYIEEVFGFFNDKDDAVWIESPDGEFLMNGINRSGGNHGATAACIYYD